MLTRQCDENKERLRTHPLRSRSPGQQDSRAHPALALVFTHVHHGHHSAYRTLRQAEWLYHMFWFLKQFLEICHYPAFKIHEDEKSACYWHPCVFYIDPGVKPLQASVRFWQKAYSHLCFLPQVPGHIILLIHINQTNHHSRQSQTWPRLARATNKHGIITKSGTALP